MLVAPELSGAPDTGLHLVDHQHDAVLVGPLAQPSQEAGVGRDVAALAEHRFDDERGGVRGGGHGLQQVIQLGQREIGGLVDRPAVVRRVRERGDVHTGHHRRETRPELGARGGHRRRGDGAAVEAAVEHHDVGPSGGLAGQPQRGLDGFAAGVGEEHPVQPGGQHLTEAVDEVEQGTVHDGGVLRVDQRADLALGGLDDVGVAVSGAGDADAGGEVEIPSVVLVVEHGAFAAGGQHAGCLLEDGRKSGHSESLDCRRVDCQQSSGRGCRI